MTKTTELNLDLNDTARVVFSKFPVHPCVLKEGQVNIYQTLHTITTDDVTDGNCIKVVNDSRYLSIGKLFADQKINEG